MEIYWGMLLPKSGTASAPYRFNLDCRCFCLGHYLRGETVSVGETLAERERGVVIAFVTRFDN